MISVRAKFAHKRYEWLDQARGLVALLFVISAITWSLSGSVIAGSPPPIGPPHLNHGYTYFKAYPSMITIIDVGQSMFLFMVGVSGYLAFSSRLTKRGGVAAWMYGARRIGVLIGLSFLSEMLEKSGDVTNLNWPRILYEDVLSQIAIGSLAVYLAVQLVKRPERRVALAFVVFSIHAFIFGSYTVDRYPWWDGVMQLPHFPLATLNLCAIAVIGSAVGQWIAQDPENPDEAMRTRIVPLAAWALVLSYALEWVQPSEHHDVTTALALMGVGFGSFQIAISYALDKIGVRFAILGPMGRNLLIVFVLSAIVMDVYMGALPRPFLQEYPFATLLLAGLVPILAMIGLTQALDRWNIAIRA